MNICKKTLNEININGTAFSAEIPGEITAHLEVCGPCAAAYREAAALENCLLAAKDLEPPANLRYAVMSAISVNRREAKRPLIPALRFAFKTAGVFALAVCGAWLGLQTASGGKTTVPGDFDLTKAAPYNMNIEPVAPVNLAEIYFSLIEEE